MTCENLWPSLGPWGLRDSVVEAFRSRRERGPGATLGRIVSVHYGGAFVETSEGRVLAHPSGKSGLRKAGVAVGDWVALALQTDSDAVIHEVLPRFSHLTRHAVGGREGTQLMASNCDRVAVVMALDEDFNPRRLERYVTIAETGGVRPCLVLTKPDLVPDLAPALREVRAVVNEIYVVHGKTGEGLPALTATFAVGETIALLGSSGVGKSSIVNRLAGSEVRKVGETRAADGKGRHTSTHRELLKLEMGTLLIDTPGMREVGIVGAQASLDPFLDIAKLAALCRFRDCKHTREPGCAVKGAVEEGSLDAARLANFQKIYGVS
jgi:ribosome biogenesis GTPase / thiamine phosphate phosphatase